ncbi:hypothetical protein [Robinsoniella peoriensis]|uniref:hypothetical protein n=1 Tax=Robinsoniella peoriensis TaxID=180332 RepID=UPI0005C7CC64|nr:hypothetical protein [Robinsoniella peoriensis]
MTIDEKLDLLISGFNELKAENKDIRSELKEMTEKMELIDLKQDLTHKKLDNLTLDVKVSERAIKKDIRLLQDAQDTLIEVLEQKNILPSVK